MKERILFVDDEPNILHGIQLLLRKKFKVEIALGPLEGLKKIKNEGPYAVVVSDLKMPGADGIEFLEQVWKVSEDSVRMLLTGHGDLESAVDAVNRGKIFRFMNKPCPKDILVANLEAGIEQYRLVQAEREVLRGTLRGTIRVLSNILSLVNPEAFGRGERIKGYMNALARAMRLKNLWQYELAALLSQIGWVSVSSAIADCQDDICKATPEERAAITKHPEAAAWLLSDIPRMEGIIGMIRLQQAEYAPDAKVPVGAYMLKLCLDFDGFKQQGVSGLDALRRINNQAELYHPEVLARLVELVGSAHSQSLRSISLMDLQDGWVFAENLTVKGGGRVLIAKGHVVSPATRYRLKIFSEVYNLEGRFVALYPPLFGES